jgi:hypothetical protein
MANELQTTGTKSGWVRPENYFTYLPIIGAVVAGVYFWGLIVPFLITLLENTLLFAGLAAATAIVGWVAFSSEWHLLLWHAYKMGMRWVTRRFIEIDPIAIMMNFRDQCQDKLGDLRKSIAALEGQALSIEQLIHETADQHDKSMKMALQAKNHVAERPSYQQTMVLQARRAGKLEASNVTYQGLLNKLQAHLQVTKKMEEAAQFMVEEINDTVEIKTKERQAITTSYKAMAAARRIIQSDKDRAMYDQALEITNEQYNTKLGEISKFIEDSQSFMDSVDLTNGSFEEEALAKLGDWEQKSNELMGVVVPKALPESTGTSASDMIGTSQPTANVPAARKKSDSFADLFEQK